MKTFGIWEFEIVFENCETVKIAPSAIKALSYKRDMIHGSMHDSSNGMVVVEEEYINDLYLKLDLNDKKSVWQQRPDLWTDDPKERLIQSNDITHITMNGEYLAVPYKDTTQTPYINECQISDYDENKCILTIRIKKDFANDYL